ncbi:MAG: hypothetical protein AAGN82_23095 [Myxococcota bacterium]
MEEDRFARPLRELDVVKGEERKLLLLPSVHVAWADGPPGPETKRRLNEVRLALTPTEGFSEPWPEWAANEPKPEDVVAGCELLNRLLRAPDDHNVQPRSLMACLMLADWVARGASGPGSDGLFAPTERQRRARQELRRWLAVDIGDTWRDVVADVGSTPNVHVS